ncbi:Putative phage portal protein [Escherichia coli]|nr:Putative phage portal protein [Escherichia coli]
MRLRLMQTDAHGIRRETRRGDIARLCRRPNAQQNRIQFFELWLNAKLRHGNTVVLKIRNARGQIKELRILDWSRVEPLVADDGEVFYRITPDRNCGITEAVTVPAREVIHDRFNCFFIRLWGCRRCMLPGWRPRRGIIFRQIQRLFSEMAAGRPGD